MLRTLALTVLLAAAAVETAAAQTAAAQTAAPPSGEEFEIVGKDGKKIGDVTLTASPHGTLIDIAVMAGGLPAGKHGLHFHDNADCSDIGEYKKSGSHVGHGDGKHGLLNPNGPEPGDLPNLIALSDGSAQAALFTSFVKLDELKAENGSALLIHADKDDHMSQPIGNAGARIACAPIK